MKASMKKMTKGTKKMMTGGMANPNAKANLETYSPESRTKASTTMSDAKLAKKGGMMPKKQVGGTTQMANVAGGRKSAAVALNRKQNEGLGGTGSSVKSTKTFAKNLVEKRKALEKTEVGKKPQGYGKSVKPVSGSTKSKIGKKTKIYARKAEVPFYKKIMDEKLKKTS